MHTVIGAVEEGDELLLWRVRCWWWWWWWWWWLLWTLGSTLTTSSTKFLESWWLRKADCSKFMPRGIIPPPLRAAAVEFEDPNCSIPTSVATVLPYPTGASGTAKICSKKSSPNPSELLLPAISNKQPPSECLRLWSYLFLIQAFGVWKTARAENKEGCCVVLLRSVKMADGPKLDEPGMEFGLRFPRMFCVCVFCVEFEKKESGRIGFGSGLLWMVL